MLLKIFEDTVFVDHSKVFLVVADFNPDAKRLYEHLGYQQVGVLPNLYKDGIAEHLMMKGEKNKEFRKNYRNNITPEENRAEF